MAHEPCTYREAMGRTITVARIVQDIHSRGALAKMAGMNVATLNKIENGTKSATYDQLCALADALQVKPLTLLQYSVGVYRLNTYGEPFPLTLAPLLPQTH